MYNKQHSLTIGGFLYGSVLVAIVDATIIYFTCFYALAVNGQGSVTDLFSLGKVRLMEIGRTFPPPTHPTPSDTPTS